MNYQKAEFKASYGLSSQLPESDRPEFVFSGRSNVGKSSLINRLCSRKNLARVSSTPGKTATINFYTVDGVYFVDLPGYGYAKVSGADRQRWDELISTPAAKACCWCSCWTAGTPPRPTIFKCWNTCTFAKSHFLWP